MARMIPSRFSDEVTSFGERESFKLFEGAKGTDDWFVLHSYALRQSKEGEIDFLVLAPGLGVFCLEVKSDTILGVMGGSSKWLYLRKGKRVEDKDPFKQASNNMHKLLETINNQPEFRDIIYGYGVMLINTDAGDIGCIGSPEYPRELVFDKVDFKSGNIVKYIKRLSEYFESKYKKLLPNKNQVNKLMHFLRPSFEKPMPLTLGKEIEEKQERYTEEQFKILDGIERNDRILVNGSAGTGKTMMALEVVKRALFKNEKVFFTCFNKNLRYFLEDKIKNDNSMKSNIKNLELNHFHEFLYDAVKLLRRDRINQFSDSSTYLSRDLPRSALESIKATKSFAQFDRLVIDEGQDLITNEYYLDVFDAILKGGLIEGKWFICCDERQTIYEKSLPSESILKKLKEKTYPSNFTIFDLKDNCRNTKQIAEKVAAQCGFKIDEVWKEIFITDGDEVEFIKSTSSSEQTKKVLEIIGKLISNKISPNKISILSFYKVDNSDTLKSLFANSSYKFSNKLEDLYSNNGIITCFTIHSFKGLENSYIILIDIDKDIVKESHLYVGMTRARVKLYVMYKT